MFARSIPSTGFETLFLFVLGLDCCDFSHTGYLQRFNCLLFPAIGIPFVYFAPCLFHGDRQRTEDQQKKIKNATKMKALATTANQFLYMSILLLIVQTTWYSKFPFFIIAAQAFSTMLRYQMDKQSDRSVFSIFQYWVPDIEQLFKQERCAEYDDAYLNIYIFFIEHPKQIP